MPDELPMNDPQKLWQGQPTEPIKMSLEEIRRRMRQFQAKARLRVIAAFAIGLLLFVGFGRMFIAAQNSAPRFGCGVLSLWSLYGIYQAYKWMWPANLGDDAELRTSLEFYRRELERRRDYTRHIWRRSGLIFCLAGLALIVIPELIRAFQNPRLLPSALPFLVLLAIWFIVFTSRRKTDQQKLQREIDELSALEGESRT